MSRLRCFSHAAACMYGEGRVLFEYPCIIWRFSFLFLSFLSPPCQRACISIASTGRRSNLFAMRMGGKISVFHGRLGCRISTSVAGIVVSIINQSTTCTLRSIHLSIYTPQNSLLRPTPPVPSTIRPIPMRSFYPPLKLAPTPPHPTTPTNVISPPPLAYHSSSQPPTPP